MFSFMGDSVLLIKKERPLWQRGLYNGIGGKQEKGETSVQAMVREFEEEAGIKTEACDWRPLINMVQSHEWDVKVFYCYDNNLFNFKNKTDEKCMVCNPDKLPSNIVSNLKWLIPLALDSSIKWDSNFLMVSM